MTRAAVYEKCEGTIWERRARPNCDDRLFQSIIIYRRRSIYYRRRCVKRHSHTGVHTLVLTKVGDGANTWFSSYLYLFIYLFITVASCLDVVEQSPSQYIHWAASHPSILTVELRRSCPTLLWLDSQTSRSLSVVLWAMKPWRGSFLLTLHTNQICGMVVMPHLWLWLRKLHWRALLISHLLLHPFEMQDYDRTLHVDHPSCQ